MKLNKLFTFGLLVALLSTTILSISCSKDDDPAVIADVITEADKASLLFMLEEEKLARDVYTRLHDTWGSNQFANIKESEQRHMNYVTGLLVDNNIAYPISEPGVFQNSTLQTLYNNLIEMGLESKGNAFTVGATIEDVDIFDLKKGISETTNQDIIAVYEKLLCGSKNHMRAFTKGLSNLGLTYSPQYISADDYAEILSGENQHCG